MARSTALRRQADIAPRLQDWYEGAPVLVPAVELDEGHALVCPFCHDGVHTHDADGLHKPACKCGPRARYLVRSLPPTEFVELMLRRLGFEGEQAREIIDKIA